MIIIYRAGLNKVTDCINSLLVPFFLRGLGGSIAVWLLKVARYSFSGPIPPKFEHKLRRHKQSFGKIATTVVLDEDENLL